MFVLSHQIFAIVLAAYLSVCGYLVWFTPGTHAGYFEFKKREAERRTSATQGLLGSVNTPQDGSMELVTADGLEEDTTAASPAAVAASETVPLIAEEKDQWTMEMEADDIPWWKIAWDAVEGAPSA